MATEVRHGPSPRFRAKLARGRYAVEVVGHYTKTPGLTAAGVTRACFESTRAVKRQAELLGMRTAFLCWFVVMYEHFGASWAEAVRAITTYPFGRLRRLLRTQKGRRRLSGHGTLARGRRRA